jgi:large subunit ribosomal protein L21e
MVMRIGGSRRKSRHKMAKSVREKGKIKLAKYFQVLNKGDHICLQADPSIHSGLYHTRFHGKTGVVVCKKGVCYEVKIKDLNMFKTLIVHPVHLKRI